MNEQAQCYHWQGDDLILSVRVQPRASRDRVVGLQGDRLKIQVTAPPVEGRANAHLLKVLAGVFGVPPKQVALISGDTGRDKRLRVTAPGKLPPCITRPG